MKKIEAIEALLNGECDGIKHESSVFISVEDSIVNKRGKRPLDMKNLTEEGWETYKEPRWYDDISKENGVLCWVSSGADVSIVTQLRSGMFFNNYGDELGSVDDVVPVKLGELDEFIIDSSKKRKKKAKKDETAKKEEKNIDDGVTITEGNDQDSQNESSKTTAKQKGDAGNEENTQSDEKVDGDASIESLQGEEIPF